MEESAGERIGSPHSGLTHCVRLGDALGGIGPTEFHKQEETSEPKKAKDEDQKPELRYRTSLRGRDLLDRPIRNSDDLRRKSPVPREKRAS